MKKSIVKYLSALLALVLVLSALPMAALAAEADEHEHSASCCSDATGIMPAMAACEDGQHVFYLSETTQYTDCGGVHRVDARYLYTCGVCAYFYTSDVINSYYAAHSYSKTAVGTDPDSGLTIYYYVCACGNSYYGT